MDNQKEREAFEKWASKYWVWWKLGANLLAKKSNEDYVIVDIQTAWESWQARAAAILEALQSPEMVEEIGRIIHKGMGLYGEETYKELIPIAQKVVQAIVERVR